MIRRLCKGAGLSVVNAAASLSGKAVQAAVGVEVGAAGGSRRSVSGSPTAVSGLFRRSVRSSGTGPLACQAALPRRGLEEFREPTKFDEDVITGRAWTASDLRKKSFADLHKLWFVLYKERNMLYTTQHLARRHSIPMRSPIRKYKVRRSMGAIKQVVGERSKARKEYLKRERMIANGWMPKEE